MAQTIAVRWVDDLDGSEASSTVEFVVGGRTYEIDLSDANRRRFDEALAPFVAAARVAGRGRQRPRSVPQEKQEERSASDRARNEAIRAWAKDNGYEISDRGRIRSDVIAAYESRNAAPAPAAAAEPAPEPPAAEAPAESAAPKRPRRVAVADPFAIAPSGQDR